MLAQEPVRSNNGRSILRVAPQAGPHRVNGVFIGPFWKVYLVVGIHNGLQLLDEMKLGERRTTIDHFVQNATERPNI